MLHHANGVAVVGKATKDADEAVHVPGVETDGGFIESEQGLGEGGSQAGGEVHSLGFATAEGARGAVEVEVSEADLLKIAETSPYAFKSEISPMIANGFGVPVEIGGEIRDRHGIKVWQGVAAPTPKHGCGLEATASAVGTSEVAPILGEENAHVHFVGLRLQPAKEPAETIPHACVLEVTLLTVKNEGFLSVGKKAPRFVDGKIMPAGGSEKVLLGMTIYFSAKGPQGAGGDGK